MKKKNNKNKKKSKKYITYFILLCIILLIGIFLYLNYIHKLNEQSTTNKIKEIQTSYNQYVVTKKDTNLYDDNFKIAGEVTKNMYLELEDIDDNYSSEYFKIKNSNLYVKYNDIDKSEKQDTNIDRVLNYIPFDKSIVTNEETKLYIDEDTYYIINESIKLPIIIDDEDKYYALFDNKLIYVNKDSVNVVDSQNSTLEKAIEISVLNYHFVINKDAGEDKLCEPSSICHTDTQFDSHMKYISENGFYTITMKELEMFIDGKINLPKKSVAITIDDGWFVYRAIPILEKYNVMGTLFLIGSLAPVSDYASSNLEVHSHTWNLHNVSNCSSGRSPLLCYDKNLIVEDLKKSRESLNNTTYFCYPFYEYNDHAISVLKEAGFTMALTGQIGDVKVRVGTNKFKVPRYVIYNNTTVNTLAKIINN